MWERGRIGTPAVRPRHMTWSHGHAQHHSGMVSHAHMWQQPGFMGVERLTTPVDGVAPARRLDSWGPQAQHWQVASPGTSGRESNHHHYSQGRVGSSSSSGYSTSEWRPPQPANTNEANMLTISEEFKYTQQEHLKSLTPRRSCSPSRDFLHSLGTMPSDGHFFSTPRKQLSMRSLYSVTEGGNGSAPVQDDSTRMHQPLNQSINFNDLAR